MNEDARNLYFNRPYKGKADDQITFCNFVQKLISFSQSKKCLTAAVATFLSA